MRKHVTFIAFLASVILFSSCGKDKDPKPANSLYKVKTYTEAIHLSSGQNITTTFNLEYDGQNRVTSITSASAPGNKFVITYPSKSMFSMDIYNNGSVGIHEDFFLNSHSLVDSTMQVDDSRDTTTEKYLYNTSYQLMRLSEYDYYSSTAMLFNTTDFTYDAQGNLAKSTDSDNNTETYTYYPDLVNIVPVIIPGKGNADKMNLLKTHTVSSNGSLAGSSSITYTFDDSNRVSSSTEIANDGTSITKTFTYF